MKLTPRWLCCWLLAVATAQAQPSGQDLIPLPVKPAAQTVAADSAPASTANASTAPGLNEQLDAAQAELQQARDTGQSLNLQRKLLAALAGTLALVVAALARRRGPVAGEAAPPPKTESRSRGSNQRGSAGFVRAEQEARLTQLEQRHSALQASYEELLAQNALLRREREAPGNTGE